MAGNTIEKDKSAISNPGLWDQRAVLEWIQQHIVSGRERKGKGV
jgi:carboxylesterase type B